jgi:hypothetical protein
MSITSQQAGIQAGDLSSMAMANLAVNSFAEASQENANGARSFAAGAAGFYITDQHRLTKSGAFTGTGVRVLNPFPSMPGIKAGNQISIATPSAALSAGDYLAFSQPIEGNRIARLGLGSNGASPFKLGFVVRPTIPLTFYAGIYNDAGNRSIAKKTFAPANADTFVPLDFDPETTGAWVSDTGRGLEAFVCFAAGANYIGNAGGWLNSLTFAGADQTNLAAVTGQSVIISGLLMFPGKIPLYKETFALLARHTPQELQLCQRYLLYKYYPGLYQPITTGSNFRRLTLDFPVPMRTVPVCTYVATTGGGGNMVNNSATPGTENCYFYGDVDSAITYVSFSTQPKFDARF